MIFPLKFRCRVASLATPIADQLSGQNPPAGCSEEQWREYCAAVREAENLGIKNPEFVSKTWEKKSSSQGLF